jgi:hypothetical protein
MEWTGQLGTKYRLAYRPWSVPVHKFQGPYWEQDGTTDGVLVEVTSPLGDVFFARPEALLFTRQDIEARDLRVSDRMKARATLEACDCGCESMKPADAASAAWLQAAAVVRCEPIGA